MGKISTNDYDKIVKLFNDGTKCKDIGGIFNVSSAYIYKILKNLNITKRHKINDEIKQNVVTDYIKGLSSLKIAKKYKIEKSSVLKILKNNNIKRRSTKKDVPSEYKKSIINDYLNGITTVEIKKKYCVSEGVLNRFLKKENVYVNKAHRPIDEEKQLEVCEKYKKRISSKEITKEYNISPGYLNKILKRHGVEIRKEAHNKIDENTKNAIINEYVNNKLSICEIKEKYGFGTTTVARWLRERNLTRSLSESFCLSASKGRKKFRGTNLPWFSSKMEKWVFADSLWECVRMKQLDEDADVEYWDRCRDYIPYLDENNSERHYMPDLYIKYKNGVTVVEEIKPSSMANKPSTEIKTNAAKNYYKNKNILFKIVTENNIGIDNIKKFKFDGLVSLTQEQRKENRRKRRNERLRNNRRLKKLEKQNG